MAQAADDPLAGSGHFFGMTYVVAGPALHNAALADPSLCLHAFHSNGLHSLD